MKTWIAETKTALLLTAVFVVLLCGAYPLAVWGSGQALFRWQAGGSLITDAGGIVRGSALIGQNFSSPRYFHPRPSAAGSGYDAANSNATNLGPTSQKLAQSVQQAVAAYRAENALPANEAVPADAVTSSGSGLDPDISVANALIQARRVAKARGLPPGRVLALVAGHVAGRDWGLIGEPRVNVLELNRALDGAH